MAAREADSSGSEGRPVKGLLMGATGSHIWDRRAQRVPELRWYVLVVSLEFKPSLNVSSAKEGLISPYSIFLALQGSSVSNCGVSEQLGNELWVQMK